MWECARAGQFAESVVEFIHRLVRFLTRLSQNESLVVWVGERFKMGCEGIFEAVIGERGARLSYVLRYAVNPFSCEVDQEGPFL